MSTQKPIASPDRTNPPDPSPESAIDRDPMSGQAHRDPSLTEGADADRSDGARGSTHAPEGKPR